MPSGIYLRTKEHNRNNSEAHKGIKHSEKTKKKISKTHKGKKHYWHSGGEFKKGIKCSEETKKKMSESRRGEKHPNWKGGISYELYPSDWTEILKESIRERDNYICQLCGIHQDELKGFNKKLDCHHIDYNKDNLNPENLITLCRKCHIKTNFNRDYWINYFDRQYEPNFS